MAQTPPTYAIILAAGSSVRFGGDGPKQFLPLAGRPLVAHTVQAFEDAPSIREIILVVPAASRASVTDDILLEYQFEKVSRVISGGATRAESTKNGLEAIGTEAELIAIHDGARPTVSPADIERVIQAAAQDGAAILGSPVSDTLKRVAEQRIVETVDRGGLYAAQTPQVFRADLIRRAHDSGATSVTDDAQAVEALGVRVTVVESRDANIKVTRPEDFALAEAILSSRKERVVK